MADEGAEGEGSVAAPEGAAAAARDVAREVECTIRIGGAEFVLVRAGERAGGERQARRLEGVAASRGQRVREARRQARLTQCGLAALLGKTQSMVSQAENGRARIGEAYVQRVLAACRLSPDWGSPEPAEEKAEATGWDLHPRDIAGLDPETLVPVRKGSERDLELRRTVVWWADSTWV